jgi:hypothetical protein
MARPKSTPEELKEKQRQWKREWYHRNVANNDEKKTKWNERSKKNMQQYRLKKKNN